MRKILLPPVMLLLCIAGIVLSNLYMPEGHAWKAAWISGAASKVGYLIIIIGILLPAWGAKIFKEVETNILPYNPPDKMVTKGPFGFTRNPMYLGMLLGLLGIAWVYGTYVSLVFPPLYFAVANWWYIPFEEGKMAEAFGGAFTDYKMKVRRWI